MDGKVIIGTEIDDTGFEKGLKKIDDNKISVEIEVSEIDEQIRKIEERIKELNSKATIDVGISGNVFSIDDTNLTEQEEQEYDRLTNLQDELYAKKEQLLALQNQNVQAVQQEVIEEEKASENINKWVDGTMELSNGTTLVKKNIDEMAENARKLDFSQLKKSVDKVGNSVEKVTKKVARWALAIFGVRSAYMFVRNAINTIAGDDEQLKADIDYIKSAIAYSIEPLVRGIVNLAKQLMFYLGYIIKSWTGKNIFENANKSLKNATNGAKKLNKELNKTVAGFDEMNVLQDTSSSSGGTDGGVVTPSFDLSNIEDIKVPGWIQWIADNGNTIIKIIEGIGAAIAGLKIATLLKDLGLFSKLPLWKLTAGIGLIILGIIELIQDVISFIKEPTWEKFGEILTDIGIILAGIAIIIGSIPLAVAAAIAIIVGLVISNWDKIKEVLGVIGDWINKNVIQPISKLFSNLWNTLKTGAVNAWNGIKSVFSGLANFFGTIFSNAWNKVKAVFSTGGKVFTGIKDGILNAFKKIVNTLIDGINKVIKIPFDGINKSLKAIKNINILGQKPFKGLVSTISVPKIPHLAKGGIINMPGRGVPIGNAIAGERGQEGVIPLTDSQQMQLLGEAIGKYIKVDLTNITNLDGRQIARKVEQINQNNKFVLNR